MSTYEEIRRDGHEWAELADSIIGTIKRLDVPQEEKERRILSVLDTLEVENLRVVEAIQDSLPLDDRSQHGDYAARLKRGLLRMRVHGGPWHMQMLFIMSRYYLLWTDAEDKRPNSTQFPFDGFAALTAEIARRGEQCIGYYRADYVGGAFVWEAFG